MGVYKREKRWYVRWSENGRIQRRSLGSQVTTKAQALDIWRELKREIDLENYQARLKDRLPHLKSIAPPSFHVFRNRFLEARRGRIADSTLERYDLVLRLLEAHLGPDYPLDHINSYVVAEWASLRLDGGVSPAGVNTDLRHLKAALRWAAKEGYLDQAPEIEFMKEPRRLPRHLTPEQVSRLLSMETHPERKRLWTYLVYTGCRRGEALGLNWEDIIWEPRPAARVRGKGDRERWVPLLPSVVEALGPRKDVGPVFPEAAGVHRTTVSHWFRKLTRQAKVEARLHDLRHTCFTWLASQGVPLRVIQEIAGHATIATTEIYSRGLVADLHQAMEPLTHMAAQRPSGNGTIS